MEPAQKWWVAVTIAFVGAMAPTTVAVQSHYQNEREATLAEKTKERELALAEAKAQYEALDRAIAAGAKPEDRRLVLRFLTQVSTDKRLHEWAVHELEDVEGQLAKVRALSAVLAEHNAKFAQELQGADAAIAKLDNQVADMKAQVEAEEAKAAKAKAAKRSSESRSDR